MAFRRGYQAAMVTHLTRVFITLIDSLHRPKSSACNAV